LSLGGRRDGPDGREREKTESENVAHGNGPLQVG